MDDKKVEIKKKAKPIKINPKKAKIQHSEEYFLIQSVHMDVLIKKRNVDKNIQNNDDRNQNDTNLGKSPWNKLKNWFWKNFLNLFLHEILFLFMRFTEKVL